jgi:hypothetical protein
LPDGARSWYVSPEHRERAQLARAGRLATAMPAAALAAGTALAPAAGSLCECNCGRLLPSWPPRPTRKYVAGHGKRQARRDERRQLRELKAAAAVAVAAAPEPARRLLTAASVSEPCRILATVSLGCTVFP